MTFAIHSAEGKGFGAGIPDYPPPFRHCYLSIIAVQVEGAS